MLNQRNLASIVSVKLLPKDDITSMPDLNLAKTETDGPVVTSGTWVDIDFTLHSAVFKETAKQEGGFTVWPVELVGQHVEIDRFTMDDLNKRYIADVTDANGIRLLVGTDEQPLTLTMVNDSGNPSKGHFATLTLGGVLGRRAPIYNP